MSVSPRSVYPTQLDMIAARTTRDVLNEQARLKRTAAVGQGAVEPA